MSAMSGLRPIDQSAVFDSGVIVPAQAVQAAVKAPSTDATTNANPAPVIILAQDAPRDVSSKGDKETIRVTAVTHESDQTPGTADISCGGTATALVTTGNVNCDAYNPPRQHRIAIWRRDVMDKVQAEDGRIYTITCSANWLGSNCASLIDGDKFEAEVEKTTMWITAYKGKNQDKEVRVKYKILDIR
jgi:hypothetical protein